MILNCNRVQRKSSDSSVPLSSYYQLSENVMRKSSAASCANGKFVLWTFLEHFDPRQDGRSNLQDGSPPCFCADVEQQFLMFWRGDVEAGIINRDGSGAAESILADVEEKRTP